MRDYEAILADVLALLQRRPGNDVSRSREIRGRIADQANKLISHFYGLGAHLSASNFPGAACCGASPQRWDKAPLTIRRQCRIHVCKPLRIKRFHGVRAGNAHECSLKLSIGKASWVVFEKQMVLRTKRLIRVRKVRCLRSIFQTPPDLVVKFQRIDIVAVIL